MTHHIIRWRISFGTIIAAALMGISGAGAHAAVATSTEPTLEELPLSDEAVSRAAPLFRKMENPLGCLMASLPDFSGRMHTRAFEAETRSRALATVIALRLWALDHGGALPGSLQMLVDAGLLPALPLDAFSGQPLHYSKRRELVWSVGPNARDDEGKRDAGIEVTTDDLSWLIGTGPRP